MNEQQSLRRALWAAVVLVCLLICSFGILPRLASTGHPRPQSNVLRKAQLDEIARACIQYHAEYKAWPVYIENLYETGNPRHLRLINCETNDAWGHPIIYEPFETARGFGLVKSLGRDNKPGGNGADQDFEIRLTESGLYWADP